MDNQQPPQFPVGEFVPPGKLDVDTRNELAKKIENVPAKVRATIDGLSDQQLDTRYRNWTIRQIVHHLADSHVNCYIRFKWALTEPTPTIKAYDESLWSELPDAKRTPIESSLLILEGIHARWAQMIRLLSPEQMQMQFFHPESKENVSLDEALPSYVWHADHHLGQIDWLKKTHNW